MLKNTLSLLALCFLSALLTGCGKGDYDSFKQIHQNHDLQETVRTSNQSRDIKEIALKQFSETTDPTVKALIGVFAMNNISQIKPVPLDLKAPTTGMDVFNSLTAHVPSLILGGTASWLGYQMAQSAGDRFILDDNAQINGSFNPTTTWMNERDDITTTTTTTTNP